ncbi:MAG: hypothetical protein KKD65_10355, partial [Gammaproteobacteria bacterium]|nr:hypothetical protein [Gammaproteobacteria bacterium]
MPDRLKNSALSHLRQRLDQAFSDSFSSPNWGAPASMTKVLAEVKKRFDPTHVCLNERSIARSLLAYRSSGRLPTFVDLKYVCFGLAQQVGQDDWSLIEDGKLFRALLKQVGKQTDQPRRLRKCFQGLMHGYFDYPIFDQPADAGLANWKLLRKFLADTLSEVIFIGRSNPEWLKTLNRHENLLTDKPCERYAPALLKGNVKDLVAASEGVGLSSNSWVWQEATMAQTKAVIGLEDAAFKTHLAPLLDLLDGNGDVQLSDNVVIRCLAQVLIRYAKCNERPENPALRDMAITFIGNPWLKRAAWDAYIKNENARKMVDGWLKHRLINDFFALLSEDGAANPRRLDYWLRFVPVIEDMWFVLGENAKQNQSADFKEMKKRMAGRLHYLGNGTTADNNAFVMRMGKFMVVEFGVTGNACFVFSTGDMVINPESKILRISQLKGTNHVMRLLHSGPWESNFDSWLCPRLGWKPSLPVGTV